MNNESKTNLQYVFEDTHLTQLIELTNLSFEKHEKYFIEFYYNIYKLKKLCEKTTVDNDKEVFEYLVADTNGVIIERNNKFSFNKMIKQIYNIDKTQLSRGLNILKRFSNFETEKETTQNISIKPEFENYSYSKLIELLPYQDNYINALIDDGKLTSNQSVKDIRKILQNKSPKIEIVCEPFDIERQKEYMLQEFRNYGRNDLIAIAYQCYQSYLRQKKQFLKLKLNKEGK